MHKWLPVSEWRYEVEAAVHPVVHNVSSVQSTLVAEVALKLIIDVLDDSLKAYMSKKKNKNDNQTPVHQHTCSNIKM